MSSPSPASSSPPLLATNASPSVPAASATASPQRKQKQKQGQQQQQSPSSPAVRQQDQNQRVSSAAAQQQHSISNDDDEVVMPQRSRAPSNPLAPNQSALGMAWGAANRNTGGNKGQQQQPQQKDANAGPANNHTRRPSATAASWRSDPQQFQQQQQQQQRYDGTAASSADYDANQPARLPGRSHSVSVNHAAELMNIAARKMAQKAEERKYGGGTHIAHNGRGPHSAGPSSHGADQQHDGEEYDHFQLPKIRARSKSISYDPVMNQMRDLNLDEEADDEITDLAAIWSRVQATHGGVTNMGAAGAAGNPGAIGMGSAADALLHRRSSTYSSYNNSGGSGNASWESSPQHSGHHHHQHHHGSPANYGSLPSSPDRLDRLRSQRRFSISPTVSTGGEYDMYNVPVSTRPPPGIEPHMSPRRHSVAGPMGYQPPGRYLSDALTHMPEEHHGRRMSNQSSGYGQRHDDDFYDNQDGHHGGGQQGRAFSDVGRGVPLHALPSNTNLYIVEFKAGRSDIFYVVDQHTTVKKGDLVIVEADRGKDLGKVINDSITPHQIHMLQAQQSEALSELHRVNREIHPKRIYRLAEAQEIAMLVTKSQDEAKAMAVCQTKVRQKKLPMEVVDGEYQWDRRKLTFYFIADRRIDFRELVRDLFKIYKTRIWMCAVNPVSGAMSPILPASSATEPPPLGSPTSAMGGNQFVGGAAGDNNTMGQF
ncbi:hypothetical protein RI367_002949 [Sorochytrium milnesiophthora]